MHRESAAGRIHQGLKSDEQTRERVVPKSKLIPTTEGFYDSFASRHAERASRALIEATSRLLDLALAKAHFSLPTARQTGRRTGDG
jgi:hypothetical protein